MIAGSLRIWEFGFDEIIIARKVSKYGVFSGPYFPVFGLNTEIYSANLRIQSGYRKIRTRKNYVFGHFSRSGYQSFWVDIPIISERQNYGFRHNDKNTFN